MFRSRWLRSLFGCGSSRKDRRRQAARSRKTVRLVLEALEERVTPSGGNPTVTQTAGGYTALKAAVASDTASNTNYVIQITNNFIFDSGGQVAISKLGTGSTLTIEGQNGTNFTLTGYDNRLFYVSDMVHVTFKDLTLTGGEINILGVQKGGGAILNQGGNVMLSKVAVKGNTVQVEMFAEGGGIYVSEGGTLTIQGGSTIQSNHAIGNYGAAEGGGVYVSGASTITISDSSISNNSIQGGQGSKGDAAVAEGGGVYVSGASTITISDSSISNNSVRGGQGGQSTTIGQSVGGSSASGGGLYVAGSGWTVTLTGDTLSGNTAVGGNGANGATGSHASGTNASGGNGGNGGVGGNAEGGAAFFSGSGSLNILNDSTNPSTMINNSVQAGAGGAGGTGGTSTGTANNSNGGNGGAGGDGKGGAIETRGTLNANIGNTTFYGNKVLSGNGGSGGAAGTGGSGAAGKAGTNQLAGTASGGGTSLESAGGSVTMVNSTVANNTDTAGLNGGGTTQGSAALGGGILDNSPAPVTLDNNTITQNTISGKSSSLGAGVYVLSGNPTLINNLIQGNQSVSSTALDLKVDSTLTTPLSNATNNFIGSMSANAVSTTTNIVGNSQVQLGNVVGVDSKGNPTGGPIYYPLLSGVVSIGAGTTSILTTIATVEGTTAANATDEVSNPRSSNSSIDLGAVQFYTASAPVLSANPTSQTAVAGATVSFTASASGNPPPWVQWQVSTYGPNNFSNLSGATNPTLTLTVAASMNGNEYRAVFTNSAGSITSPIATLTVQFAPTVTTNPSNQTSAAGGSVSFTAAANGNPPPSVQWQVSTDGGKTFTSISGATTTTLTLNNVTASMSGNEYEAVFSNSVGNATSAAATLTVTAAVAPVITGNPSSQTVSAGQTANFTASASGSPTPSVQWQVSTDGGKTFTNISGATTTTLTLPNVTTAMSGNEYLAFFSNSAGNAITNVATLTVTASSAPTITTQPTSQTVTAGQSATFTASASGAPTPTVQWRVSTDGGKTFSNLSGATSTTLTLNNVAASMNGYEYQAVFSNSVGSATTSAATLTVQYAPTATTNPSNRTVTVGANVSFMASANGNPAPTVQWQVSSDGGKTFTNISGATSTTLTLNNVSTSMSGNEYEAVFTNSAGSVTTSAATLTVNAPPPSPPPSSPPAPPAPLALNVPPLLALFNSLFGGGIVTMDANGTETITDSFFGIPLLVSTFDSHGDLVSVDLFGFDVTFLFLLL